MKDGTNYTYNTVDFLYMYRLRSYVVATLYKSTHIHIHAVILEDIDLNKKCHLATTMNVVYNFIKSPENWLQAASRAYALE